MRPIHPLKFWFGALVFALGLSIAPAPDPGTAPSPYKIVRIVEKSMDNAAWAQMPPNKAAAVRSGYATAYYCNYALGALCGGESYSRSGTIECVNSSGVYAALGANVPCFEYSFGSSPIPIGLRIWQASENYVLYSRDLTQAGSWTLGATMTAAKTATGIDGVANSATLLTGGVLTATNTALQAVTLASASDVNSVWIRCVTCTGAINLTFNGGSTWTAATSATCSLNGVATALNTSQYVKCVLGPTTMANPSPGIQIANSGDAIDVDDEQLENVGVAGPPIFTAGSAVPTSADVVTLKGLALTIARSNSATTIVKTYLLSSLNKTVIGDSNAYMQIQSSTATVIRSYNGTSAFNATVGGSGNLMTGTVRSGLSWSASSRNLVADGGVVVSNPGSANFGPLITIGSNTSGTVLFSNGYFAEFVLWNETLPNSILQRDTLLTTNLALAPANDNTMFAANDSGSTWWGCDE
jgi:hypothetical protein